MTEIDRRRAAASPWAAAASLLNEARTIDPETAPTTAIHASYYAMFDAARGVLVL